MCPACLTTAALIIAGTTSAGGLTALLLKQFQGRLDRMLPPRTPEHDAARPLQSAAE